jgi:hypothetical protein
MDQSAISLHHLQDSNSVHRMVDERMQQIEDKFKSIANLLQLQANRGKAKGSGRGKRSNSSLLNEQPEQSTSQDLRQSRGLSRNRGSNRSRGSRNSSTGSSLRRAAAQRLQDFIDEGEEDVVGDGETRTIYIQKVDCQFNGNSLDSIEDKSTEDESMQQFWRMYYFNGQLNSLYSNGLTYNDFR